MNDLLYIMLVTDEDGVQTAYGPWSESDADERAENMQRVYPHAHVQTLALLTAKGNPS